MDGYKFWNEKLNGAKLILAPMVDQSELAWRMLSRKYGAQLCYTPMFHAAVFVRDATYRKENFTTCKEDRPLIVQFCSDDPEIFSNAAVMVQNECDAVDLNLGCPQGIARRGHYGSFLQDEWDLINKMIETAVKKLSIPVTAKIRVFEDIDKTVQYAKMLENAGVSLLTVHGRTREQKGSNTGLASWKHIKAVKENVKIPVFANGNILFLNNAYECMKETGCDGVMIAEGSLQNPCLFADQYPPVWEISREYLTFVKKYECPLTWVRGHIFKICRKVFDIHTDFRDILAKAKTMELIYETIDEIENICLKDNTKEYSHDKYNLKYWQCQPYIRKVDELDGIQKNNNNENNDDKEILKKKEETEIQSKRKKRKLEKLERKNKLAIQISNKVKVAKYEKCFSCSNPKSVTCDHLMCRACCRDKTFIENLECIGHKFKKKLENEKC